MGIPRQMLDLSSNQGGVVTRAQMLQLGYSPSHVDWLVRSSAVSPIAAGVYRVLPAIDPLDLVRGAVASLPNAVVSHQSAAHLLRFPTLPTLVPTVAVPSHTTHVFPDVTVRRYDDLDDLDVVTVDGTPVTNATRTLFDLGGVLKFRQFDSIGESLLIAGRMELDLFDGMVTRLARRGKPGSKAARDFIQARSSTPGTVLERKGRALLSAITMVTSIHELRVPWSRSQRFDDAYPEFRIAIEWDSREWHQRRLAMANDRKRDREAVLHGWTVLRFTWDDVVNNAEEVVETVRQLIARKRQTA